MIRKILMMTANPTETAALKLNDEIVAIHEGLSTAQYRDQFQFLTKTNLSIRELRRMMLNESPQIVHFSGHGTGEAGIILQDDFGKIQFVRADALSEFFEQFSDSVECVILNACYSEIQAKAISQHIPYVIGMSNAIGDKAACEFSAGFYDALGAGKTIPFAFNVACNAIHMAGIKDDHLVPVLLTNPDAVCKQSSTQPDMREETKPTAAPSNEIKMKIMQLLRTLDSLHKENGRFALIREAMLDSGLEAQIDANQPLSSFVPNTIALLASYGTLQDGRHALEAFLLAARNNDLSGQEFRQQCDAIFMEWLGRLPASISVGATQELPTPKALSQPRSTVNALKQKALEQELAHYQKQYEAVLQQKLNELNAMNQVTLQSQLDQLEQKMRLIEQQLSPESI